jgi:hypothetical protein
MDSIHKKIHSINRFMLINIQNNAALFPTVVKKKLFLRHNFENEKDGKEKNSASR